MSDETDPIGDAIRRSAESVEAPARLRGNLTRPKRRPRALLALVATAAAALVLAVVLVAGGDGGPSVAEVARASLAAPQRAAAPDTPDYGGWRPVGARDDTLDGRTARTVIYRRGATGAHYAIVDGTRLTLPSGGRRVVSEGTTYVLARAGDVTYVAWHREKKTCVLASKAASGDALLRFATQGR